MKKIKIIHVCPFSKGACGVWNVVYNIAKEQAIQGHEVHVFSSNIVKGEKKEKALAHEEQDGIKIHRFPVSFAYGDNLMWWDFKDEFMEIKPDVAHCHVYRHPHCLKTLALCEGACRCIITTHSPFVDSKIRGWKLDTATKIFDFFDAKSLNEYDKVIAICEWELPYLKKLGVKKSKIEVIPNGVPIEFLKEKINSGNGIFYLGRLHPLKDIPTLGRACRRIGQQAHLIGPPDENYIDETPDAFVYHDPIYDLNEKIKAMQECSIFVLPSLREAMPGALLEALALGKVCIASRTQGAIELIKDGKNGFLFDAGDDKALADLLSYCLTAPQKKLDRIRKNARKSVSRLSWTGIAKRLDKIYREKKQ